MDASVRSVLSASIVTFLGSANLSAQALTTSSIDGYVMSSDSAAIEGATVSATNTSTGERRQTLSRAGGRYSFEYLTLGGPYTISARSIGHQPQTRPDITLSLGERRHVDFELAVLAIELANVEIIGREGALINAARTGPSQTINSATATGLPVKDRDFSQLTFLSPQAVVTVDRGTSIAGQSDRLNALQIDGANNSELGSINGLFGFGTAGAQNGARALSVEALRELQVLVAPFDVRYGGFAGGLVNAVTRSGSNKWEGSLSAYYQTQQLTGKDSSGVRAQEFSTRELVMTLAGPIVQDRAAFFLDVGLQREVGARGLSLASNAATLDDPSGTGILRSSAERFQQLLAKYGVDPGALEPRAGSTRAGNVFAKITLSPAINQRIEISYNFARGTPSSPGGWDGTSYNLGSRATTNPGTVSSPRLNWTTAGTGRFANELMVSRLATTDRCELGAVWPTVGVNVDNGILRAGRFDRCDGVRMDNATSELTDNLTIAAGSHHFTVGAHGELLHQQGVLRRQLTGGRWTFTNLNNLEAGRPSRYRRQVVNPAQPQGSESDFRVRQASLYTQDQWNPVPNLTITTGLRFDVPFLPDSPPPDPLLASTLQINSSSTPNGNLLWSPRLGFNYDLDGATTTSIRGGIGMFSGRPIYAYFSDVYETAGLEPIFLDCSGVNVPAFTLDPAKQPSTCPGAHPVSEYTVVDPSFRFPRNLRVALGTDVRLPWNLVGTVDLLYIKAIDQLDVRDANLKGPTGIAAGEGNRVMYGSIDEDGNASPSRRSDALGRVVEMRNSSGDRAFSATAQLQRQLRSGNMSLAYTHTTARDRMSAVCFNLTCNLDFVTLNGSLENRSLSTASFESTHKITFEGLWTLPAQLKLGAFYNGFSGIPYTYLVAGDVNADGLSDFGGNDAVYLPRDASDISLADPAEYATLDKLIESTSCLRAQRGHVMRRNSCHDHWLTVLNARVSRPFAVRGGQSVEVIADVFNLLNLLNSSWGIQRRMEGFGGDARLLNLIGYDGARGRGIYELIPVAPNARDVEATRWRLQLGARYVF